MSDKPLDFASAAALLRDETKTNYEKLGLKTPPRGRQVDDNAEENEQLDESIRLAIKQLALIVHPDKVEESLKEIATAVFLDLQKIREEMSSARSRLCYNSRIFNLRTRRFLVLMDMGGSLLCKTTRPLPNYDFQLKINRFFVRPHCAEFLKSVLDPNFGIDFAIYTSRQRFNAEPQINMLGKAVGIPNLIGRVFYLYAGDEFSNQDPVERHPDGVPKTIRSLPKIWMHPATCRRPGIQYDECNTINIDNEARKMQDHPENGVVVPSYEESDVLDRTNDKVLLHLRDYLAQLKNWGGDVRDYLRMYPFDPAGRSRLRVMMKLQELEDKPQRGSGSRPTTGSGPRSKPAPKNNQDVDSLTNQMRRWKPL